MNSLTYEAKFQHPIHIIIHNSVEYDITKTNLAHREITKAKQRYFIGSMLTFADGRSEESFSSSSGIAKGSKKGDEENVICGAKKRCKLNLWGQKKKLKSP